MSISALMNIARQYLFLGTVLAILATILFLVGYFIVYKKILKGTKRLEIKQIALWAVLLIYIIVVLGATLGIRSNGYGGSVNLHLFSSYIEAWQSFSSVAWRNIILNILMFVPLGVLLPLVFNKCKKFWVTYLIGFLSTILLEVIQLISGRGIFELDDIFNNTLGCVIGYGFVMIFILTFMDNKKTKKNNKLTLLYLQIPLCITILGFSSIFITYKNQEFGNFNFNYTYKNDMSNIKVSTDLELSNNLEKAYVYSTVTASKEDTLKIANEILKASNTKVDESLNDVYDEAIVYKSSDSNYSVWVYYTGLTTWYTNFNELDSLGKEGLSYEEVKSLLNKLSVELPNKVEFEDDKDGNYSLEVDMFEYNDILLDGNLNCTISENNVVSGFTNNIITFKKYKECDIISEQEAYDKILKGEYRAYLGNDNYDFSITNIELTYEMDSKGFYQPVYKFSAEEVIILIPALK